MWSDWLVFCDCGFQSACSLFEKDKRIMEASWWERLTEGENWVLFWWVGPCLVHLQSNFLLKTGAVFPPCNLTWGQTIVEVMKIMSTSFKKSHARTAHSVPPALQQATSNPRLPWDSWILMGKSGSVFCGVTAPFTGVLVHTRFCLCPPKVCFPCPM